MQLMESTRGGSSRENNGACPVWHNSRCNDWQCPQRKNTGNVCRIAVWGKLWQSEYGSTSLQELSKVIHWHLLKGFCYSNMGICHVSPDSKVYSYCNSQSNGLSIEEGTIDPEGEEMEACTHTTIKDQNESYYTGAILASKIHNLLSSQHRVDGEGVQIPVGDIS